MYLQFNLEGLTNYPFTGIARFTLLIEDINENLQKLKLRKSRLLDSNKGEKIE